MKSVLFPICISIFLFSVCSNMSPEDAYEKGSDLLNTGNTKKAYDLFKTAIRKDPQNTTYHVAAGSCAPDQNSAFVHFKNAWEKGLKTESILSTLLKLSFHVNKTEKMAYGISLYKELPESLQSDIFLGELYFQFAMYDSAITLWKAQQIEIPSANLCNNISLAYANKGQIDSALTTLIDCKNSGLSNSNSFIQMASLFSMNFDYPSINKLFTEIENGVYYNSAVKLERATYLLIHDRLDQALEILALTEETVTDEQRELVQNSIRTMKAYIALMKNQPGTIDTLLASIYESTPNGKNETELLEAIKAVILNDSTALKSLETARSKNLYNPLIDIICARINVLHKKYESALTYYTSLPGILQWSPRIITETATTLAYAGKENDAIQRVSLLHKHGIYTKQSLEIFRDITFKMNLLEKSATAQQLLEKKYGNDINIKWHGLILALKEGKIETAENTLQELLQRAPDDERFITTKFSILFLKKEYDAIINQLPSSGLSPEKIKPLEAMAWLKSGDTTKAIAALESGIRINDDIQLMTELAQLYLYANKPENAALVYKKIIDRTRSEKIDSLKTAAILNNYAWVLSTSENSSLTTALGAARKAYELAPDNIHIIDTYASILLKSKKFKECISLLTKNEKTATQSRLLCHLAEAYEQTADLNKARRYYEDAIKIDAPDQLPLTMSKETIQEHIKELLSNES